MGTGGAAALLIFPFLSIAFRSLLTLVLRNTNVQAKRSVSSCRYAIVKYATDDASAYTTRGSYDHGNTEECEKSIACESDWSNHPTLLEFPLAEDCPTRGVSCQPSNLFAFLEILA